MHRPSLRFFAVALGLLGAGGGWADNPAKVQLGFFFNFVRYVEWPASALKPGAPLQVCMAPGNADLSAQFTELARQPLAGLSMAGKVVARPADVASCHALYIPAEAPGPLSAWIDAAHQAGALTVSDAPDFINTGGIIGLVPVGGRYRFDIDLGKALMVNLRISSHLLKLAKTVK
ncbi:MAG: YfiR family protein [Simplicispira sp.]|nr:YfiR family protein [Simplicispira sp.]